MTIETPFLDQFATLLKVATSEIALLKANQRDDVPQTPPVETPPVEQTPEGPPVTEPPTDTAPPPVADPVPEPVPQPDPVPAPAPTPAPEPTPGPQTGPAQLLDPVPSPQPQSTNLPLPPAMDETKHPITYAIPTPASNDPIAQVGLSAVLKITANLKAFVFNESDGVDVGLSIGEFVTQHRTRVTRPDCGFVFFWGRDTAGPTLDRLEMLVELDSMNETNPANVGPYTVDIYKDGYLIAQNVAPYHWSRASWRWESEPRKQIRTIDQVRAFFPKMAPTNYARTVDPLVYRWIMDNATAKDGRVALVHEQDTPGDRGELGILNISEAEWLLTESPVALASVFAMAETMGSKPNKFRDPETGLPCNFIKHPGKHWLGVKGGFAGEIQVPTVTTMWRLSSTHTDCNGLVAYLLTDDPYLREQIQFHYGPHIGWTWYHRVNDGAINGVPQPVQNLSETREWSWAMRDLIRCIITAPKEGSAWPLPKSYYQALLPIQIDYFNRSASQPNDPTWGPNGWHQLFTSREVLSPWMDGSYGGLALAQAVLLGFEELRPMMNFVLWFSKLLASGKDWPLQWFAAYQIWADWSGHPNDFKGAYKIDPTLGWVLDIDRPVTPGDMATIWQNYIVNHQIDVTKIPTDPTVWAQNIPGIMPGNPQSDGYPIWLFAALNAAAQTGDLEAKACAARVAPMVARIVAPKGGPDFRWSFAAAA